MLALALAVAVGLGAVGCGGGSAGDVSEETKDQAQEIAKKKFADYDDTEGERP